MEEARIKLEKINARLEAMNFGTTLYEQERKIRDSRYERWFKEIAQKVGITLVP